MSLSNNFPTISPSLLLDFANTKRLDPRVTFTRSTTAVYYDGVTTAMAEQNLLTWSQDFDNAAWTKSATTVTANTTVAPDGTTTADTVTASSTSNIACVIQGIPVATGQTVSVYAKAGTSTFIGVQIYNAASWANFNLSSGVVASSLGCTASIVSVGSGWYRCILANCSNSASNLVIAGKDADPAAAPYANGNMTSGNTVFIWGAQLEKRASVTAYTPTTTAPITNYIPQLLTAAANVPRFDCNPTTGESLGLLIEEQRTNLLLYSSDFDNNSVWGKVNTSINANTVIAPDGTLSGDKLVITSTATQHVIYQNVTTVTSQTYAQTFYIKKAEWSQRIRFSLVSGGNVVLSLATSQPTLVSFDLTVTTPTITDVGNGWYRVSMVAVEDLGGSIQIGRIVFQDNSGGENFAGDNFSGIYIWGAQFEAATFPTSYIATVASTVTRSVDLPTAPITPWFNISQGSWYVESTAINPTSGAQATLIAVSAGGSYSAGNGMLMRYNNGTSIQFGGNSQAVSANANAVGALNKIGASYQGVNASLVVNGGSAGALTNLDFTGSGSTTLIFGALTTLGQQQGTVRLRKLAYFPKRLTDAELQALTL